MNYIACESYFILKIKKKTILNLHGTSAREIILREKRRVERTKPSLGELEESKQKTEKEKENREIAIRSQKRVKCE